MKKVVYSIILFAVVAVMYSCTQSPEKLAVGTWKLDSINVLNVDDIERPRTVHPFFPILRSCILRSKNLLDVGLM